MIPANAFAPATPAIPGADRIPVDRRDALHAAAVEFEASFLAEMLRLTGVAKPPETANGGAGESAFAGLLSDAYAEELARAGGIGLSEHVFAALVEREIAASGEEVST